MNERCKIGRMLYAREREGQRVDDRKTERIRQGPHPDFTHAMSRGRSENGTVVLLTLNPSTQVREVAWQRD